MGGIGKFEKVSGEGRRRGEAERGGGERRRRGKAGREGGKGAIPLWQLWKTRWVYHSVPFTPAVADAILSRIEIARISFFIWLFDG